MSAPQELDKAITEGIVRGLDLAAIREMSESSSLQSSPELEIANARRWIPVLLDAMAAVQADRDTLLDGVTMLETSLAALEEVGERCRAERAELQRIVDVHHRMEHDAMNDPLAAAIAQAILAADDNPAWELGILGHKELGQVAALAVRAWLALPPSDEEIEAVMNEIPSDEDRPLTPSDRTAAERIIAASRAVLVRPPEVEEEPS